MEQTTGRCAVLGDPVAHSLSPVLHRAGYRHAGLDWSYDAVRVQEGTLAGFVGDLDPSWRGLSVTAPLKREARSLADRVTEHARLSGAVNTLVLGSEVVGHNTDLPGAVAAVRERSSAAVAEAVLLGGGATAASVGLALAGMGASRLVLVVRDPARAAETVDRLRAHPAAPQVEAVTQVQAAALTWAAGPDVVVSTVPAAAQDDALIGPYLDVPVAFDVVYDPWPTPLAQRSRGQVVSGLDLLVHQAVLQFELFTGLAIPVEVMRSAGEAELRRRGAR